MSDRLEEIRKLGDTPLNWRHCGILLERDQFDWIIAEIDRLRERVDRLWKAEVNASDECERLRQETIPGRCGECAHLIHAHTDPGYCEVTQSWWDKNEFCNRFKPKDQ